METSLNLHCPACGAAIVPQLGCCACCLTRAMHLQAARFGTELVCRECGGVHVILRTDASRDPASRSRTHLHDIGMVDWQIDSFDEPNEGSNVRKP